MLGRKVIFYFLYDRIRFVPIEDPYHTEFGSGAK